MKSRWEEEVKVQCWGEKKLAGILNTLSRHTYYIPGLSRIGVRVNPAPRG